MDSTGFNSFCCNSQLCGSGFPADSHHFCSFPFPLHLMTQQSIAASIFGSIASVDILTPLRIRLLLNYITVTLLLVNNMVSNLLNLDFRLYEELSLFSVTKSSRNFFFVEKILQPTTGPGTGNRLAPQHAYIAASHQNSIKIKITFFHSSTVYFYRTYLCHMKGNLSKFWDF